MGNLKLKGYRVSQGLTQKDMAAVLGCSTNSYNMKENGVREFTETDFKKIKSHFDMSPDKFCEIFLPVNYA